MFKTRTEEHYMKGSHFKKGITLLKNNDVYLKFAKV